jgi:hypothetical protein
MSAETKEILENKEVIAIDQALGRQGRESKDGDLEVWARPLKDGGRAVIFFNRGTTEGELGVSWEEIAYPGHRRPRSGICGSTRMLVPSQGTTKRRWHLIPW